MSWAFLAASCIAIIAGMEMAQTVMVLSGLGGMVIALVMLSMGKRQP